MTYSALYGILVKRKAVWLPRLLFCCPSKATLWQIYKPFFTGTGQLGPSASCERWNSRRKDWYKFLCFFKSKWPVHKNSWIETKQAKALDRLLHDGSCHLQKTGLRIYHDNSLGCVGVFCMAPRNWELGKGVNIFFKFAVTSVIPLSNNYLIVTKGLLFSKDVGIWCCAYSNKCPMGQSLEIQTPYPR